MTIYSLMLLTHCVRVPIGNVYTASALGEGQQKPDAERGHCMQLDTKHAVNKLHHQASRLGALHDLYHLEHHAAATVFSHTCNVE